MHPSFIDFNVHLFVRLPLKAVALCFVFLSSSLAAIESEQQSFNSIVNQLTATDISENIGGVRRSVDLNIKFAFGSAELLEKGAQQLDVLVRVLNEQQLSLNRFEIVGHTDASGSEAANLALSQARAVSVKRYLVDSGVAAERLDTRGAGETELLNAVGANHARNRRVEIVVLPPKHEVENQLINQAVLSADEGDEIKITF